LACGNPKIGSDFSTDNGNLPKEVLACFESKAYANAVRPIKLTLLIVIQSNFLLITSEG
jgi:hypothetical protein